MADLGYKTNELSLKIGGVEQNFQAESVAISSADTDAGFVSFAATSDGKTYSLDITAVQGDLLWVMSYNEAGTTKAVIVEFNRPDGSKHRFTGNVVVKAIDGVVAGGQVDKSQGTRFTSESSWEFTAKPVMTLVPAP